LPAKKDKNIMKLKTLLYFVAFYLITYFLLSGCVSRSVVKEMQKEVTDLKHRVAIIDINQELINIRLNNITMQKLNKKKFEDINGQK